MKVLLLSATPPPIGGIATWTARLMSLDLPKGLKYELVDEKMRGNREMFGEHTKKSAKDEIKRCIHIWKELSFKLTDKKIKIVQTCIPAATLSMMREIICGIITKMHGRKFITHFHCTVPNMKNGILWTPLLLLMCKLSDCIIVLNKESKDYLKRKTKKPISIIPNFVVSEEIANSHNIGKTIKRVVYVGGVIESKGVLEIIKVAVHFPEITFRLIGNPEQKVIDASKQVKNVQIVGVLSHEKVSEELKKADVFMFLSQFPGEGFSVSLLEAMAAGLPCVVTDWAANSDMIEGKGGEIVPVKNVKATVEALNKMWSQDVRERQSEFNINKVRKEYVDEEVIKAYLRCYERCLVQ